MFGLLLSLAFVTIAVCATIWFATRRNKVIWVPLLLCALLSAGLNAASYLYYAAFGTDAFFRGLSVQLITAGLGINLVFLVFWLAGYVGTIALQPRRTPAPLRGFTVAERLAIVLLLVGLTAKLWLVRQDLSYAYAQVLYAQSRADAGSYGIMTALNSAVAAVAAAYLCWSYRRGASGFNGRWYVRRPFRIVMWSMIVLTAAVGLFVGMQRGRVLEPAILAAFVLLMRGNSAKSFRLLAAAVVALLVLSPIIDYIRSPYRGAGSWRTIAEAYRSHSSATRNVAGGALVFEAARKSLLPVSSAAMYKHTEENGIVGFATYPSIVTDMLPRFLMPDKPYPLSSDGTAWGRPTFIVGAELGLSGVTYWDAGGAVMYWQFGWLGVVLGGLVVGALWAFATCHAFLGRSFFALILFLAMLGWGLNLLESLDFLLHRGLSFFRLIGPLWLLSVVLPRSKKAAAASVGDLYPIGEPDVHSASSVRA